MVKYKGGDPVGIQNTMKALSDPIRREILEQLKAAYARQAERNYPLHTQLQYTQRQTDEKKGDAAFMI